MYRRKQYNSRNAKVPKKELLYKRFNIYENYVEMIEKLLKN